LSIPQPRIGFCRAGQYLDRCGEQDTSRAGVPSGAPVSFDVRGKRDNRWRLASRLSSFPVTSPAATVERRPVEVDGHSAEWWRQHNLAEARFHLEEARLDYNTACSILGGGDPDATGEDRGKAKIVVAGAFSVIGPLEEEIKRLQPPPPRSDRTPAQAHALRMRGPRPIGRPRERRPGRRRRTGSRASPDDDPGGDGDDESDVVVRRRRGWAP
jgi:hypothetical protein